MRILLIAAVAVLSSPNIAMATMPILTEMPNDKTTEACKQWASKQDEDATDIWGTMESGKSSKSVAISRLADYCLTGKSPEIVGFWSSYAAGVNYCKNHNAARICRSLPRRPAHVPD